jgi:uncharacterized protein
MNNLTIRFYAYLNGFLPAHLRQHSFDYAFRGRPAVKNVIETIGVPHTEVAHIRIDETPADFSRPVFGGERVAVYPAFRNLAIADDDSLRPTWAGEYRFILDNHLGKLATQLRMAGFDASYPAGLTDAGLADLAVAQNRILLTHDRQLLMRRQIVYAYHVWSMDPATQLAEVLQRFGLASRIRPFTRCLVCNEPLADLAAETALPRVPAIIREQYQTYKTCPSCHRVYWPGIHYDNMLIFLRGVQNTGAGPTGTLPFLADPDE